MGDFEVPENVIAIAKKLRRSSRTADWLLRCVERIEEVEEAKADAIWQDEAFSPIAPNWAVYEPEMMGERCADCKAWCTIVRPGKTQCDNPKCKQRIY